MSITMKMTQLYSCIIDRTNVFCVTYIFKFTHIIQQNHQCQLHFTFIGFGIGLYFAWGMLTICLIPNMLPNG